MREDNEKPFGGYEHCSEADVGAFPVYTAPVDAVNMRQERVDETAKCEHEPWPSVQCACGGTIYFKHTKREWVGLTHEERDEIDQNCRSQMEALFAVEAKLKEKNA